MSWSIASSLIKPLQQWYSEINSATLTGAIDVVVIEHEDGTFVSSPFHVRFGKLGVLKAREKIVDIEVNDEAVDIHMKLDEYGAAFFVEDLSDSEDEDNFPPELATSPIPGSNPDLVVKDGSSSSVNRSLLDDFNAVAAEQAEEEQQENDNATKAVPIPVTADAAAGHKGKLNRKKRKRRQNLRHSRNSSRSSLKEIAGGAPAQEERDSSESSSAADGGGVNRKTSVTASTDGLEDGDENDGDDEETDTTAAAAAVVASTPLVKGGAAAESKLALRLELDDQKGGNNNNAVPSSSFLSHKSDEQSLLLSRLGGEATIDSILDSQAKQEQAASAAAAASGPGPGRVDYFSEPEMSPVASPLGSRPGTPNILSDSEYETKQRQPSASSEADDGATQQSWEWGKLPSMPNQVAAAGAKEQKEDAEKALSKAKGEGKAEGGAGGKEIKRQRTWTFSLWSKTNKEEGDKEEGAASRGGVYLDDIKDDQEMLSIYVGSSSHREQQSAAGGSVGVSSGSGSVGHIPHQHLVDDDAESGKGPSLPMSPHSVEGAIGGPPAQTRMRYDSSDDEHNKQHLLVPGSRLLPGVAISLCGGLDAASVATMTDETSSKESAEAAAGKEAFSPALFEQGLISYDDFEMHLRNPETRKSLFSNPDLVARIGDTYYKFPDAVPVIMSAVLYGRRLPPELAPKGVTVTSTDKKASGTPDADLDVEAAFSASRETSPNTKSARSSWWPFGSRREQQEQQQKQQQGSTEKLPNALEEGEVAKEGAEKAVASTPAGVEMVSEVKRPEVARESSVESTAAPQQQQASSSNPKVEAVANSSEGESDPDLRALSDGVKSGGSKKKFKKSLRLTSEDIKRLGLKPGANEVQFSVTTAYQGTTRCRCHVYWWKSTDKVVISDIDGTITKSDVLGHVLPIIGRDWAQSGVASLFTKIVSNGYHIAYLSARAIGQASITKDYLKSISQGDVNLPDGPLFLNPTSLVNAFHREVIEKKPEKFKIACLRDIQKLFPEDRNPFYAGYGNRVNDVFAYRTVGIPISRIFTINSKGELRHELTQTFQTSYDCQSSIVDHVFPPLAVDPGAQQEFSSFAFWRDPLPNLEDPDQKLREEQQALEPADPPPAASTTTTATTEETATRASEAASDTGVDGGSSPAGPAAPAAAAAAQLSGPSAASGSPRTPRSLRSPVVAAAADPGGREE